MIPEIGFMIGCYIITKATHLGLLPEAAIPVKIFSVITIIVTFVVCLDLFTRGLSGATGLK